MKIDISASELLHDFQIVAAIVNKTMGSTIRKTNNQAIRSIA